MERWRGIDGHASALRQAHARPRARRCQESTHSEGGPLRRLDLEPRLAPGEYLERLEELDERSMLSVAEGRERVPLGLRLPVMREDRLRFAERASMVEEGGSFAKPQSLRLSH